jgi:hypothetical protein
MRGLEIAFPEAENRDKRESQTECKLVPDCAPCLFACSQCSVSIKRSLRGAVVRERRDGGVEAERRENPAALGAGPSGTVIVFQPNHTSTHRFFLVFTA